MFYDLLDSGTALCRIPQTLALQPSWQTPQGQAQLCLQDKPCDTKQSMKTVPLKRSLNVTESESHFKKIPVNCLRVQTPAAQERNACRHFQSSLERCTRPGPVWRCASSCQWCAVSHSEKGGEQRFIYSYQQHHMTTFRTQVMQVIWGKNIQYRKSQHLLASSRLFWYQILLEATGPHPQNAASHHCPKLQLFFLGPSGSLWTHRGLAYRSKRYKAKRRVSSHQTYQWQSHLKFSWPLPLLY